ncbi:MAG: hypothetical protein K0U98_09170 [Deltaproteobacteria bacterium]|nr:hypothetical protein [Deltaproteobacteria bacterium]
MHRKSRRGRWLGTAVGLLWLTAFSPVVLAETITWTGVGTNSFGLTETTTTTTATNPCNTETVTASFSNPDSIALAPYPGLTGGGVVPYMGMNGTAVGQTTVFDLTFGGGLPVENLTFGIYDNDQNNDSGSAWTDIVTITAAFGPTATTISAACSAGTCSWTVSGSGTTSAVVTGDTNNPTFLADAGQADLTIPGPVDQVTVTYGVGGPGTVNQFIGFTDLTFDCSTVPVTLASFASERSKGQLEIEWTTSSEIENLGFEILGKAGEDWRLLDPRIIPSHQLDSLVPQRYSTTVADAEGAIDQLMLAEVDRRGRRRAHGPFKVGTLSGYAGEASKAPVAIDWSSIQREQDSLASRIASPLQFGERGEVQPICELLVVQEGIHRVRFEDLLAAGCNFAGASVDSLALTSRDIPVPLHLVTDDKRFGSGDQIEFLGEPLDSLYSRQNVYRLTLDKSLALRAGIHRSSSDLGSKVSSSTVTRWLEPERHYSFSSPSEDPWYADRLLAFTTPIAKQFPIEIDHQVPGPTRLLVDLWGVTDHPDIALDHHVVVKLDGEVLGEALFGGLVSQNLVFDVPAATSNDGTHWLTLELPADTGAPFDLVHLDRYGLQYDRRSMAIDDRLQLEAQAAKLSVGGFSSPEVRIYTRWREEVKRIEDFELDTGRGGFEVLFQGAPHRQQSYWISTTDALLSPQVRVTPQPQDLLQGRADYLVISHSSFSDHLDRLLEARQGQGLTTKVVQVEDLYTAYTGGIFHPEAIRLYLADAVETLGVRMVLLVGGDSYDYLDHLGLGSKSFIPTFYGMTHAVVRHAPADALLVDLDDDGIPDLPIGRLPVRTLRELELLIDKTLAFRASAGGALLAADVFDGRINFGHLSDQLAESLPANWPISRAYLDHLELIEARQGVLEAFRSDISLISYIGHSGPMSWSFDSLLTPEDGRGLILTENPSMVFAWGCWNGYHSAPEYNTLSHELLFAPGGVSALLGASGLTEPSSDRDFALQVFAASFRSNLTVGEAVQAARRRLAQTPGTADVVLGMTLLGDPALRLSQ